MSQAEISVFIPFCVRSAFHFFLLLFHSMSLLQSVLTFRSDLQSQNFLFIAMTIFFFFSLVLFTWPQISQILHTLFSPLDPFLVIWYSATLFPERKVLCSLSSRCSGRRCSTRAAQALPGEHHGGSRMELSPATDDLRSLPLTGRFCFWLSGHFSARFLGTTVVQKTDSDAFSRLPNCNFHSVHVRKLSVDTVDTKFQPSKPYTV